MSAIDALALLASTSAAAVFFPSFFWFPALGILRGTLMANQCLTEGGVCWIRTEMKDDRQLFQTRTFLFAEAAAFAIAAVLHAGLPAEEYGHPDAIIFDSVLAGILFLGYSLSRYDQSWTRRIGIAVQGIALLGTVIGRFSIIAGAGPTIIFDLVFYRAITFILLWGLTVTIIAPTFNVLSVTQREDRDKFRISRSSRPT